MTYSIVARCPKTGHLGVAAQTHWFACGASVPLLQAGVGAVAAQAVLRKENARGAMASLQNGSSAADAMAALADTDEFWQDRQMGIVDAHGNAVAHTGSGCLQYAGHVVGEGVTCQANIMQNPGVPEAMLAAWHETTDRDLAERLLAALHGAQALGGDLRGQQSAVLMVVDADPSNIDAIVDIRVDDASLPLQELSRLLRISRAYVYAARGDDLIAAERMDEALDAYGRAHELAPEIGELGLMYGVLLTQAGELEKAKPLVRTAYDEYEGLRLMLRRLYDAHLVTVAPADFDTLINL